MLHQESTTNDNTPEHISACRACYLSLYFEPEPSLACLLTERRPLTEPLTERFFAYDGLNLTSEIDIFLSDLIARVMRGQSDIEPVVDLINFRMMIRRLTCKGHLHDASHGSWEILKAVMPDEFAFPCFPSGERIEMVLNLFGCQWGAHS